MKLVSKLLNRLNGLHYSQEYLCLARESFQQPLHAYLFEKGKPVNDITGSHLFVGYFPLVFALPAAAIVCQQKEVIEIFFSKEVLPAGLSIKKEMAVAFLSLKKINQQSTGTGLLVYYEGIRGSHRFISGLHQFLIQLYNRLYNRKPGNVFLENNLYKQVQIAYSLPRKISLVTVGCDNLFNHFPTDLHGQANEEFYVISLRHEGDACKQVQSAKKIVLSDMQASACKQVYALGKNHTKPLKEITGFDFDDKRSKHFRLPLPKNLVGYKELELKESFIQGIHRFLLFKIVYAQQGSGQPATLSHVHNVYATWRYKKGMKSNYLMR